MPLAPALRSPASVPRRIASIEKYLGRGAISFQLLAFSRTGERDGSGEPFSGEKAECKRLQKRLDTAYCIYYIQPSFGVFRIRIADFQALPRGKEGL
jgi:hypothetical protein